MISDCQEINSSSLESPDHENCLAFIHTVMSLADPMREFIAIPVQKGTQMQIPIYRQYFLL